MAGSRRITIEFLGKDTSVGKTAHDVESRLGKLQGKLQRAGDAAGKLLAGGLAAGGAAMVKFGNQASDLEETQSKVNQIFGTSGAAALDKFAAGAAKSLGQSKKAALDGAATFGIIGKSAGLAGADLVGFSTDMSTLASDMASFNNTSPEEAVQAIGAAMRGEAEPIRKYGVLLDDATLRNEAMKLGLIKTTKEALTPQQKALAAQAAILRQTKDQQGDFARTSDGLANKQRIMRAQFENLTTQLGQKALPAMLKVTDWALKAMKWMEKHQDLIKGIAVVVGPLVAGLYGLAKAQQLVNFVMRANPIGLVITALAALVAGLVYAYKNSETFRRVVHGAMDGIAKVTRWLWDSVLKPIFKLWLNAIAGVMSMWAAMLRALSRVPGFGWARDLADKMDHAAGKVRGVSSSLDNLGKKNPRPKVDVDTSSAVKKLNSFRQFFRQVLTNPTGRGPRQGGAGGIDVLLGQTVGRNAKGTNNWRGGPSWVGEEGPELLNLPRGSQVIPNRESMALASGAGSGDVTATVNLILDGTVIHQALLKVKRRRGGLELGLA